MNYECHITTTVQHAVQAKDIANMLGWKTSAIDGDPLLGDGTHFYLTAHDSDYFRLKDKMLNTSKALVDAGCPVLREKIEAILYDTKTGANEPVLRSPHAKR